MDFKMDFDSITVHTKLFSEDAFHIIAACKKACYSSLQISSLDRGSSFTIDRIRNTNAGLNYQVLKAEDGEVLVYHSPSAWINVDSIRFIKSELRDFIKSLSRFLGKDERFTVLPIPMQESTEFTTDYEFTLRKIEDVLEKIGRKGTTSKNL